MTDTCRSLSPRQQGVQGKLDDWIPNVRRINDTCQTFHVPSIPGTTRVQTLGISIRVLSTQLMAEYRNCSHSLGSESESTICSLDVSPSDHRIDTQSEIEVTLMPRLKNQSYR